MTETLKKPEASDRGPDMDAGERFHSLLVPVDLTAVSDRVLGRERRVEGGVDLDAIEEPAVPPQPILGAHALDRVERALLEHAPVLPGAQAHPVLGGDRPIGAVADQR